MIRFIMVPLPSLRAQPNRDSIMAASDSAEADRLGTLRWGRAP